MNWMNLPPKYTEHATYNILPIEYEHNPTFGTGAQHGSKAILEASHHLDYYDSHYETQPHKEGITVLTTLQPKNPKQLLEQTQTIPNDFIISLGGDHAITIGLTKRFDDFHYISIDAHADYWHSWKGSQYNHACVTKRIAEHHKTLLCGVSTMDKDEHTLIKQDDTLLLKDEDYTINNYEESLDQLQDNVYISIDVDSFTPQLIKNTGTPEPGGFTWYEMLTLLETTFIHKNVIGLDIVEFAPTNQDSQKEAYILAKLVNKIMSIDHLHRTNT